MSLYAEVARNKRQTFFVFSGFLTFIAGLTYLFTYLLEFDLATTGVFLIFSGLASFVSYWNSDKIVLALSGARPANRKTDFHFYTVTENLCLAARLPQPKLYVIQDTALNAFATGRDPEHAVICVTTGLLETLDRTELEGVIAHELSHIQNYDIRLMSVVAVLVGFIALLADFFLRVSHFGGGRRRNDDDRSDNSLGAIIFVVGIVLALISPLIAELIKLAISRNREFLADASAAKLTRQPDGLVRALQKLSHDKEPLEAANKATAHLYIVNPLKNRHDAIGMFANMFATHPPIGERIARLEKI